MIISIGIDLVEKTRIKKVFKKHKKKFEKKILNDSEIIKFEKNKKNITYIAKIFCIKEAFIKALGTGFKKDLSFKKIKIIKTNNGKPHLNFKKIKSYISLSHEKNIIIAIAIILKKI